MSLRLRLTLLTVAAFGIGLVVLGFVIPRLVQDSLTERLDQDLEEARYRAIGELLEQANRPGPADSGRAPAALSEVYVEIRDVDGGLVTGGFVDPEATELSAPALDDPLEHDDQPFTVDSVDGHDPRRWRVQVTEADDLDGPLSALEGSLVVALPLSDVDETTSQVTWIVALASTVTLVALGLVAWLLIGLGLKPLRRMERDASSISDAGDLGQRVEHPSGRTELGRLGATLNAMLTRLQGSFDAQRASEAKLRRFVADASHELRTPLTSIRGYAELYRRGGDTPEQVDRSMGRIEEESERMSRLVEDLLLLARSDEGLPLQQEPVELSELVSALVDDAQVVDPERSVSFSGEPCTVLGDRHHLQQAVANVLANARVHTPAGTPIDVTVRRLDGTAEVAVADHGTGLDPAVADKVFDRFYRADPSRSRAAGGSGLGLAITAAVAAAHGGSVSTRETPGGGATFVLVLPLANGLSSPTVWS
jgi:two-component system OmpR family sensor kinase